MSVPAFSVIIPAFNAADYLGNAIRSVLGQAFPDFEIIIVNDASPDNTDEVVKCFDDKRIQYIVHPKNMGLPAARNTGIRAAKGEFIAFLDHDDEFLPEKLKVHHEYLVSHPEVGVAYNSRFEVAESTEVVRGLWIAPDKVSMEDLVLGYPFSPSDIVIRREWLLKIGLLDESNLFHGEDLNTNCRLALSGCQFGHVNRLLNYRRNHPSRIRKNLDASLQNVFRNLEMIFNDPRCPKEIVDLRDFAYAENYLVWSYWALAQYETEFGQKYLRDAIRLDPSIKNDGWGKYLDFLVWQFVHDERGNLTESLKVIFQQLPQEIAFLSGQYNWVLARTFLIRGTQDIIWGRIEDGIIQIRRAVKFGAKVDESFLKLIIHQLRGYENEFGFNAVMKIVSDLAPHINHVTKHSGNELKASYLVKRAFDDFHAGIFKGVSAKVFRAWIIDPKYLMNRGVISIFLRSLGKTGR